AEEANQKLNAIRGAAIGAGIGAAIAVAINEIKKLADETQRAAVQVADLSQKYKLSTDQVQTLQLIAERTGQSFDDLAKAAAKNPEWLTKATEEAKKLGLVMDQDVVQSLKAVQQASDDADRRLKVLLSPAVAGAKSFIADAIERIARDLGTVLL